MSSQQLSAVPETVPQSIARADLDPRTERAFEEAMAVSLLEKGGRYEVQSASGNWYEVDIVAETCTCPDWEYRTPEGGCKHLRRVDVELKLGRVPRPDGRLPDQARTSLNQQNGP